MSPKEAYIPLSSNQIQISISNPPPSANNNEMKYKKKMAWPWVSLQNIIQSNKTVIMSVSGREWFITCKIREVTDNTSIELTLLGNAARPEGQGRSMNSSVVLIDSESI